MAIFFQHAYALELLEEKLRNGRRALDVGSGSGYLTTCMALMMGPDGLAVGIDHIPELQTRAEANIRQDHPELLHYGRVELVGKLTIIFYILMYSIYIIHK